MKLSYYTLFYFLDVCYDRLHGMVDDDLAGLLGAMSPELWSDKRPMDKACYTEWEKIDNNSTKMSMIDKILLFLSYYEEKYGFSFSIIRKYIIDLNDGGESLLHIAQEKAKTFIAREIL